MADQTRLPDIHWGGFPKPLTMAELEAQREAGSFDLPHPARRQQRRLGT